jgi:ElaB/YqjD/DUF883 family membrane-anchored ribosome-binding protein
MLSFISKVFGGNKSEKDVKKIQPKVEQINNHFTAYASLTNDQLRNKTQEFRQRIREHLVETDNEITEKNKAAEAALKLSEFELFYFLAAFFLPKLVSTVAPMLASICLAGSANWPVG